MTFSVFGLPQPRSGRQRSGTDSPNRPSGCIASCLASANARPQQPSDLAAGYCEGVRSVRCVIGFKLQPQGKEPPEDLAGEARVFIRRRFQEEWVSRLTLDMRGD
jgi:hypothetical protein